MSLPPVWKIKRELRRIAKQAAVAHARLSEPFLRRQHRRWLVNTAKPINGAMALGDKVAIFVLFQPKGIAQSTFFTCDHLVAQGYSPFIVANAPLSERDRAAFLTRSALLIERPNFGYDFGAYQDGIYLLGQLGYRANRLIVMNDSTWFPVWENDTSITRMEASGDGLVGHIFKTEENEKGGQNHIESHFLIFSGETVQSDAFESFWINLESSNQRTTTIARGEKQLTQTMLVNGIAATGLLSRAATLEMLAQLAPIELRNMAEVVVPYGTENCAVLSDILDRWEIDATAAQDFLNWVHHSLSNTSANGLSTAFVKFSMQYGRLGFVKKANDIWFHNARRDVLQMEADGLIPPLHPAVRTEMLAMVERWPSGPPTDNTAASRATRPDLQ